MNSDSGDVASSAQAPVTRRRRARIADAVASTFAALVALAATLAVTVGPSIGLVSLWRWSDALATDIESPAVVFDQRSPADDPIGRNRSMTALLDWRRSGSSLALRDRQDDLADKLDLVRDESSSTRCALMRLDDVIVVGARPDIGLEIADAAMLITAAVALETLGPDHRFVTEFQVAQEPIDGVISGDLVVVGSGDPMLVSDDLAVAAASGEAEIPPGLLAPDAPVTAVSTLVDALVDRQITSIDGDVVGLGERFDDRFVVPTWESTERIAPHGGLLINRGLLFGSTYGLNPIQSAANEVLRQLRSRGIDVSGRSRAFSVDDDIDDDIEDYVTVARIDSAPIDRLIPALLADRDATGFEMLLKEVGAATTGEGSTDSGRTAVSEALFAWDVNQDDILFLDGSGTTAGSKLTCSALLEATERIAVHLDAAWRAVPSSEPSIVEFEAGDERVVVVSGAVDEGSLLQGVIVGDPDIAVLETLFTSDRVDPAEFGPTPGR